MYVDCRTLVRVEMGRGWERFSDVVGLRQVSVMPPLFLMLICGYG